MNDTSTRWTLIDLPFAARLALAAFLISVGIGYFSALVQLHFQHAEPGSVMPSSERAVAIFSGKQGEQPKSQLVRLIEAPENLPFNGSGQMSSAFFKKSTKPLWDSAVEKRADEVRAKRKGEEVTPADEATAEAEVRKERQGEIAAVVAWLRGGADAKAWKDDAFKLPDDIAANPVTKEFVKTDEQAATVKIQAIWKARCARCHAAESKDAKAQAYPLENPSQIATYNKVDSSGGAMSLTKLAQTTHVHLLGFSMLYGLTGVIVALTRLPGFVRVILAPLPLVAQVADISFWWLARLEAPYGPMFATWIPISGGIVGAGLGLQILLSLFDLFGKLGKAVLVALILAAGGGGYVVVDKVIVPYMKTEATTSTPTKE